MSVQTAWSQFLHRWIQSAFHFHVWGKSLSLLSPSHYTVLLLFSYKTMKLCVCRHTLFPWESFPLLFVDLLTSLILCTVQTSLTALQKVWYAASLSAAEYPGDAMAGSSFWWLTFSLQDSVANHCCSCVLSAGTRHSPHTGKQLLYLSSPPPPCPYVRPL